MQGRHALILGLLGAVLYLGVGAWGVVNLLEGDWFIGGVMVACVVVGVPALVRSVRARRRRERGASSGPS